MRNHKRIWTLAIPLAGAIALSSAPAAADLTSSLSTSYQQKALVKPPYAYNWMVAGVPPLRPETIRETRASIVVTNPTNKTITVRVGLTQVNSSTALYSASTVTIYPGQSKGISNTQTNWGSTVVIGSDVPVFVHATIVDEWFQLGTGVRTGSSIWPLPVRSINCSTSGFEAPCSISSKMRPF